MSGLRERSVYHDELAGATTQRLRRAVLAGGQRLRRALGGRTHAGQGSEAPARLRATWALARFGALELLRRLSRRPIKDAPRIQGSSFISQACSGRVGAK